MKNSTPDAFCVFCVLIGRIAPWSLLAFSAVISAFAGSEYWQSTAAYLAAAGVIWLALAYLLTNLINRLPQQS
jgi:hypothetical protein